MAVTREQLELCKALLGKRVRFRHQPAEHPGYRVVAATRWGMVEIDGMSGTFAPHLFVVLPSAVTPPDVDSSRGGGLN